MILLANAHISACPSPQSPSKFGPSCWQTCQGECHYRDFGTPEFDKFGSQNNLPQDSHPPKWWCISVYKNPEEEPKLSEHTSARSPAHTYYFSQQVQLSSNTRKIYPQEEVTHRGNRRGQFHQKKQNTNQGVNASRSVYFFLTCVYKSSIVPPFPVEIAPSV